MSVNMESFFSSCSPCTAMAPRICTVPCDTPTYATLPLGGFEGLEHIIDNDRDVMHDNIVKRVVRRLRSLPLSCIGQPHLVSMMNTETIGKRVFPQEQVDT